MARAHFSDAAIDQQGNAIEAEISVFLRGTTNVATIYATEVTSSVMPNPYFVSDGIISHWADAGAYDVLVHDMSAPPRVDDRTIGWGAVPGVDAGIPGRMLEALGVTNGKLADNAVGSTKLAGLSVQSGHIQDAAVTLAKLAASGVPDATKFLRGDYSWTAVPPGMDAAGVKAVIAALLSGDKIIWTSAGGTIVELYGLDTPPGPVLLHQDAFDTDTTSAYSALSGVALGTLGAWDNTNHRFNATTTDSTEHRYWNTGWSEKDNGDFDYTIRGVWGAHGLMSTEKLGVGFTNDAGQIVEFFEQSDMWGQGQLFVNGTQRATCGTAANGAGDTFPNLGGGGWIRISRQTNAIVISIYRADPATNAPVSTFTYNMSAPEITLFGTGTNARPFFMFRKGDSSAMWLDDYSWRQVQPEGRDLFVAVTPTVGPRVVKRIYGSSGGAFRSDFALATDLVAGLATKPDLGLVIAMGG